MTTGRVGGRIAMPDEGDIYKDNGVIKRKAYERELDRLQEELVKLQY
jgi:hypothetical protein